MDIKNIEQMGHLRHSALNTITNDKGFKQVFDRKLSEISKLSLPTVTDCETDVIDHSDKVLNLLDKYANELNNPLKTLKDIEPIVSNIEKELNLVEAKTSDIVPKNGEIEKFVRALSVTAHVAMIKFQRGDYI